jgi:hypothetical protein
LSRVLSMRATSARNCLRALRICEIVIRQALQKQWRDSFHVPLNSTGMTLPITLSVKS